MPFSVTEARIRRLMMSLQETRHDFRTFKDRVGRLNQGASGVFDVGINFGNSLAATIAGVARGCSSIGFPGASITVKDHASGTTLATATTDAAGAWSVSLTLTSNPQSIDVIASPTGYAVRFTGDVTTNISAHPGSNAVTQTFSPDTSTYICTSFRFYPIKLTLQLVDSVNGTAFSFTYNSGVGASITNAWNGGINLPYPGCPARGCAPVATASYAYSLNLSGGLITYFVVVPGGGITCPQLATSGAHFSNDTGGTPTFTDGPFTATFVVPSNTSSWYCASSATITITEI
jgi:hypothetical protein